jgi:DASH complex subunit ASK1
MSHDTPSTQRHETTRRDHGEDLDLTDLAISSHSTPRAPGHTHQADDDMTASSLEYSSSYEILRKQVNESEAPFDLPDSSTLPSTPGHQPFFPRGVSASTPMSSPFLPPASQPFTQDRRYQKTSDPVLHQMLDKTYRVQATPLGKGFRNVGGPASTRSKFNTTPKKTESTSKYGYDDSPISSPEPEAPQLHSEIFSSPIKGVNATPGTNRKRRTSSNRMRETPRPGMSVLTPAKKSAGKSAMWDSDDDMDYDDDDFGPSPPKTMQFHIPQSRLMRTPGKPMSSIYFVYLSQS